MVRQKSEEERVEPLSLDPLFERQVVYLCATRPRFYGRIGYAIDPESLGSPVMKRALTACRLIAKDLGRGPESYAHVAQRLQRHRSEGKVSLEEIHEVINDLGEIEDTGQVLTEDAAVGELAPILRRRLQAHAVVLATQEYAKRGNFARVMETIVRAATLGDADASVGTRFGAGAAAEFAKTVERLPTGVFELDIVLKGGMARGCLGTVIAQSGHGKSQFLINVGATSMLAGKNVLYATLELEKSDCVARLAANLLGVDFDDVERSPDEFLAQAENIPGLGTCFVEEFPARATGVQHMRDWTQRVEEHLEAPIDVILIDYCDKFELPPAERGKGSAGTNTGMGMIYDELRNWAIERSKRRPFWVWTAAQAVRLSDKDRKAKKRVGANDVADSINKIRSADLVITLNGQSTEDEESEIAELSYFVAKHRKGPPFVTAGPVPTDFKRSRIAVVNR